MELPLLQIIHYSDMHLAVDGYVEMRWALNRAYPALSHAHRQGWAGPRRAVLSEFVHLIRELSVDDPQWCDRPLWLVDTGDGTTFGDAASLEEWREWSERFEQAVQPLGRLMQVYGNHDSWPGVFPLLSPGLQWAMDGQRDALRDGYFRATWPEPPWTVDVPGTPLAPGQPPCRIELCAVNTVDHTLLENALALGVAARDRYWTRFQTLPLDTPADDMARQSLALPGGAARSLRIAAMHYPVAHAATPDNPRLSKTLFNRKRFARDLQRHGQLRPRVADLLLAGHTHLPFPGVGLLPRSAGAARHAPLAAGQCQLVCGSLSQAVLPDGPPLIGAAWAERCAHDNPYQCSVLRFYHQPDHPGDIVMERAIVGADDSGLFDFLPVAPGSQQAVERMTFHL